MITARGPAHVEGRTAGEAGLAAGGVRVLDGVVASRLVCSRGWAFRQLGSLGRAGNSCGCAPATTFTSSAEAISCSGIVETQETNVVFRFERRLQVGS